jgi:pectate lyase
MDVASTHGGGTATPVTVTTFAALAAAAQGDTPAVVYVTGALEPGSLRIGSNKTLVGLCGAQIRGHISISGAANVILRNIKVVGYGVGDCALDPKYDAAVGCSSGDDAISVTNSHHVWFDHCDVSDGTDGNLDITNGSDYVTVSWTKFHYSPRMDPTGDDSTGKSGHRFSNLIGGADGVAADRGHLNVTWHHCWWADNVNQRMPRTRAGKIHVFNNLFTSSGNSYCTNAGAQATLLVEGNVYKGVNNPLQPDSNGDMHEQKNIFMNTTGTAAASGMGFAPPYEYSLEPADTVESVVKAGVGPH